MEVSLEITPQSHAFITGGASGIGLAIGDALAAAGARVTLADIDADALATVLAVRDPARFRAAVLDTRDRAGWAREADAAEAAFGPVDVLVNNAGISPDSTPLADMTDESWDRMIAINLTGVRNGIAALAGRMQGRGRGHVVNTASMAGICSPRPGTGGYSAAKAGVVMLSDVLRAEMGDTVGVTALCPGLVFTNLGDTSFKLGATKQGGSMRGFPGGIEPEAVGAMVLEAIRANAPYCMTHSDRRRDVAPRMEAILGAFVS
ncbi:MAG: SDR family oxidoreductase [Sphingomonadales bacterium]|nr:SDR family oxidoreductase [Sphingomonadales bacterium]